MPSENQRAPTSLFVQEPAGNFSPVWQVPCQVGGGAGMPAGANEALSGVTPESTTPTTTPRPAARGPPSCFHSPPGRPSRSASEPAMEPLSCAEGAGGAAGADGPAG